MAAASPDGQIPNPNAGRAERDYCACLHCSLQDRQVRSEQRRMRFGRPVRYATYVDDGRTGRAAPKQERSEIRVGRGHDVFVLSSPLKNCLICCGEHVRVADVQSLMAVGAQHVDDLGGQVCVEEELHAESDAGSSRSLTRTAANSSAALMSSASRYG